MDRIPVIAPLTIMVNLFGSDVCLVAMTIIEFFCFA